MIFSVYVKDSAFPSLYDTATVIITVLDKNDNTPLFYEQTYQMAVPENAHSIIHTVKATDPDLDLNGLITYSIIGKLTIVHMDILVHVIKNIFIN